MTASSQLSELSFKIPDKDCRLCPRLAAFRDQNITKFPEKFNAPVPAFGDIHAEFLIAGLAPGLKGANFSGRPFTGDYAGDLLYQTLIKFGFAKGTYRADPADGLTLHNCRISNAVKCVPPENKPTGEETATCRTFFASELSAMTNLKYILALGKIAHDTILKTFGEKLSAHKFAHGAMHELPKTTQTNPILLIDSYHCSRYNTQTGRLTTKMFEDVVSLIHEKTIKA